MMEQMDSTRLIKSGTAILPLNRLGHHCTRAASCAPCRKIMETKVCRKCRKTKPLDEFYKKRGKRVAWIYGGLCKKCDCQRVRERYHANRASIRSQQRDYYQGNSGHIKARTKQYREDHREEVGRKQKAYAALHKTERSAQNKMTKALARGDIVKQPCETCGATTNIDGHHDDYSKPLEVKWLCKVCHRRHHGDIKTQEKS